MRAFDLAQALFNFPPGDWDGGERGLAALAGREADFEASLALGIAYARAIGVPRMHLMAGILPSGAALAAASDIYVRNVERAARACAEHQLEVMLEPINHRDMPRYFLNTIAQALEVIDRVGAPNVRLQLDLYHAQITEGDLARKITELAGRYTHVQIAGNPGRHEPDVGEISYPYLFDVLDASGYSGWVGCEYRPKADTRSGLAWARAYGIRIR